jgi:2-polyprenyl-3-methyl-5-hydroxy-6-metoxy-1,4-benzoquinol methylase
MNRSILLRFPRQFKRDYSLNLYTSNSQSINYSDGEVLEQYIEASIDQCQNLSSLSLDLSTYIRDWPSEYHFSRRRGNLLRCLENLENQTVLEIGAGCGAITRYLGESNCDVTAVEGSLRRARICAKRCRGLDNVKVVSSNFFELDFQEKFNVITFIGVLEYSGKYINHPSPYQAVLEKARQHLAPDGILIIAIENKLGLKYFMGCSEDHTRVRFDGIQGYISGSKIKTFGKVELESLLAQSGFESSVFLCPYPDYKIPSSILRFDNIHPNTPPFLYNWIDDELFRDYSAHNPNLFDHKLATKELERNKVLEDLSNSFLVIASSEGLSIDHFLDPNYCAWKFNSERSIQYATAVKLKLSNNGYPQVISRTLLSSVSSQSPNNQLKHRGNHEERYIKGETLVECLYRELHRYTKGSEEFWSLLKRWYNLLLTIASKDCQSELIIPGCYVDAIPQNILIKKDKTMVLIDMEWSYCDFLPIEYVLFRGLQNFFGDHGILIVNKFGLAASPKKNKLSEFFEICMKYIGVFNTNADDKYIQKNINLYYVLEKKLQQLASPK